MRAVGRVHLRDVQIPGTCEKTLALFIGRTSRLVTIRSCIFLGGGSKPANVLILIKSKRTHTLSHKRASLMQRLKSPPITARNSLFVVPRQLMT